MPYSGTPNQRVVKSATSRIFTLLRDLRDLADHGGLDRYQLLEVSATRQHLIRARDQLARLSKDLR